LNGMNDATRQALGESTACAIIKVASDASRPTLRREAISLVLKGLKGGSSCPQPPQPSVERASTLTTLVKTGWHPVDLGYDPTSGLFVFDTQGVLSKVNFDSRGLHLETVFRLPGALGPGGIAVTPEAVFATANWGSNCTIFKYLLSSKTTLKKTISGRSSCAGIAVSGTKMYVLFGSPSNSILSWSKWDDSRSKSAPLTAEGEFTYLAFDSAGNRLLAANSYGDLYGISNSDGKTAKAASNLGWVNSIAIKDDGIFFASGKKILFLTRSGDRRDPPIQLQSLPGGHLTGIAFDSAGRLSIADYDKGVIQGPVPVSDTGF